MEKNVIQFQKELSPPQFKKANDEKDNSIDGCFWYCAYSAVLNLTYLSGELGNKKLS